MTRPRRLWAVAAALALDVVLAPMAVTPAQAVGPLARREVLPNGAVLLVAERPAIPIVVVRLSVPAGAVVICGLAKRAGAAKRRREP